MKIRPLVGSGLFIQTDSEAGIAKLIVAFRNFANAPKFFVFNIIIKVNQAVII